MIAYNYCGMPLTVFAIKGIAGNRRERIEAAVVAGGVHTSKTYEAWITADPFRGGVKVLITGPQGFERAALFALDGVCDDQGTSARDNRGGVSD
jgi:hypothetical protein